MKNLNFFINNPRLQCDEDGWLLQVNNEPPYQTFFHQFSPALLKNLKITGKIEISYVGFGSQSKIEILILINLLLELDSTLSQSRIEF